MKTLLVFGATSIFGILLFTHGFLLHRFEISKKNTPCSSHNDTQCMQLKQPKFQYDKLIVIIIDALRHDFTTYHHEDANPYYHNKLPVMHELMKKSKCQNARIMRLLADSPTTTMQRLKGITTGSLPTFIDIGKNFASSEISEDNIIQQMFLSHKRITFMGDDTWLGLFSNKFYKSFPYPSFDVMDLDTVDYGVNKHLLPEIQDGDFDFIIAHFLGVDHCGHRYGPFHKEMVRKLAEMNKVLTDVIEAMSNDTLLLVLGDHGMTSTGDHGGETKDEVSAGLFVYSHLPTFMKCDDLDKAQHSTVNQIDLVPTISLLLATAIPFSNLGLVISELFPQDSWHQAESNQQFPWSKLIEAQYINAQQVYDYIKLYQDATNSFSHEKLQEITQTFQQLSEKYKSNLRDQNISDELTKFVNDIGHMCREVWAKFNELHMLIGINVMQLFVLMMVLTSAGKGNIMYLKLVIKLLAILIGINFAISFFSMRLTIIFSTLLFLGLIFVTGAYAAFIAWKNTSDIIAMSLAAVTVVFFSASATSNSFVLCGDITTSFLTVSLLFIITCKCISDGFKTSLLEQSSHNSKVHLLRNNKLKQNVKIDFLPKLMLAGLCTLAILCVRLSIMFRKGRPEAFWVVNYQTISVTSETSISEYLMHQYWADEGKQFRALLSCVSLFGSIFMVTNRIKKDGNLKDSSSFAVLVINRLQLISAASISLHWLISSAPEQAVTVLPDWHRVVFPLVSYGIFIGSVLCVYWSPVLVQLLYADGYGGYTNIPNRLDQKSIINECYKKLKESYDDNKKDSPENTPIAFGLYTVFTADTLSYTVCFINLFALLLGPKFAPALCLWFIVNACILEICAVYSKFSRSTYFVPFSCVVLWEFSASWFWFATGHQPTVTNIQWESAFVGFQGNHHNNFLPAILLVLSTFSIHILSTVSLPLLMFWPITRGKWFSKSFQEESTSELEVYKNNSNFWNIFNDLMSKHLAFYAIKLLGCMMAALIHRQHLMAWGIFAPHFLFEAVGFLVVLFSSLLVYILLRHTGKKLTKWLQFVDEVL